MRFVEVEITEILQKKVMIALDDNRNSEDAIKEAEKLYGEDKVRLGSRDFIDVSFGISC